VTEALDKNPAESTELAKPVEQKDPIKTELEAVKLRRSQLRDAALKRENERLPAEELAAEKQGLLDDEALEQAELEHGPVGKKIAVVQTELGAVIVKRPHAAIYKRYQDRGQTKTKDIDQFVRTCIVYPSKTRFDEILEEQPATLLRVADACVMLAGFRAEEVSAK